MRVAGALQVFMGTSILLTISGIFSSDQAGLLALFYVCGAFQLACGIIALALLSGGYIDTMEIAAQFGDDLHRHQRRVLRCPGLLPAQRLLKLSGRLM